MSTRYRDGSHYENHQRAAELEDLGAHAHAAAEQNGKQDHLSGPEQSREAEEHGWERPLRHEEPTVGHGILAFGHKEIEELAHSLWLARGCPQGSPEVDWLEAVKELRFRHAG